MNEFKDKFIGFVDILGWEDLVERAETEDSGISLTDLRNVLNELVSPRVKENLKVDGHYVCPQSISIKRDLDFQITQVSDSLIVSSEISPAGVMTIIHECYRAVLRLLLKKGIMCRGYITRGNIFHDDTTNEIIGSGYQEAFKKESGVLAFKNEADERGTPFVEVDPTVCNYIKSSTDDCVRKTFARLVKSDGTYTVLFPFKKLSHDFIIGDFLGHKFDPRQERDSNNVVKSWIENILKLLDKNTNHEKPNAVKKARHYREALLNQLRGCSETDLLLSRLETEYPLNP
ncbi:MAG: hypothetical protein NDI81_15040 [Desulfobacula sp.]|nr:hypothetical protein [Desulfobacula sp.]